MYKNNIVLMAMVLVLTIFLSACAVKNTNRLPNVEDSYQAQKLVQQLYGQHYRFRQAYHAWIDSPHGPVTGESSKFAQELSFIKNIATMFEQIQTQIVTLLHSDINGVHRVDSNIRKLCEMIDQFNYPKKHMSEEMSMHLNNMSMCVEELKAILDPNRQPQQVAKPQKGAYQPNQPKQ